MCVGITTLIVYFAVCWDDVRGELNKQNGFVNDNLKRVVITPRPDYDDILTKQKLWYYNEPALNWTSCEKDQYWPETGMAEISSKGEKELLEATYQLHSMCLELVELVVNDNNLLKLFHINENLWPAIKTSWANNRQDFLGRFDFAWDGESPPKMLEYNADTPSLLLESGDAQ
jgi:glutathionylspermidine synthase